VVDLHVSQQSYRRPLPTTSIIMRSIIYFIHLYNQPYISATYKVHLTLDTVETLTDQTKFRSFPSTSSITFCQNPFSSGGKRIREHINIRRDMTSHFDFNFVGSRNVLLFDTKEPEILLFTHGINSSPLIGILHN
jgi:hypothetical protein